MRTNATFARKAWTAAAAFALSAAGMGARAPDDLAGTLTRVGERVEEYFRRAQSVVCLETVWIQPLGADLSSDGRARVLEYELRVSWEPAPEDGTPPAAHVLRQLLKVDGRPPRPGTEPECMDPRAVSPEPLAMMLRGHREEYAFSSAGSGEVRNRRAMILDYKSRSAGRAEVTWRGECFSVALPGRSRGRIWIDVATGDVLRLDESLAGRFNYRLPREHTTFSGPLTVEIQRADSSIRYRPVVFTDPDETVLLPEAIESLQIVQGSGAPRVRTTQTFSSYRRFVSDARIVR